MLYDDEEILNNIERAEELHEPLGEYNVRNVNELRAVIDKQIAVSQLLPVTQQIIASLGITSVEEWTKALEDKNLAALFDHEAGERVAIQTGMEEYYDGLLWPVVRALDDPDLGRDLAKKMEAGLREVMDSLGLDYLSTHEKEELNHTDRLAGLDPHHLEENPLMLAIAAQDADSKEIVKAVACVRELMAFLE